MKKKLLITLSAVQSVSPIGAATIFIVSYFSAQIGFGAMLVVIAFLIGLYLAKRPAAIVSADVTTNPTKPAAELVTSLPAALPPTLPEQTGPFAGLVVREVKLAQPTSGKLKVSKLPAA